MDVLMPQLGETVAEGTVANWHKKVGDAVAVDEILFDVETDKVSMEVPSLVAGVITKILVPAGATVEVGTVLAVIESGAAASAQPPPAQVAAPAPAPAPAHPAASAPPPASTAEASPPGWYAAMPPSMSGAAEQYTPRAANDSPPRTAASSHAAPRGEMRLSPAVRRLAAEYRLDLAAVSGSGRNGRITRRNVVDFIEAHEVAPGAGRRRAGGQRAPAPPPPAAAPAARAPSAEPRARPQLPPAARCRSRGSASSRPSTWFAPRPRARTCCKPSRSTSSASTKSAKTVRDAFKAKHGHSLTYLPFIAHAVCEALHDFPNLNSSVQADGLVLHEHVNLGVAVDLGAEGLVAPVIKAGREAVRRAARGRDQRRSRRARAAAGSGPTTSRTARTRCRTRARSAR